MNAQDSDDRVRPAVVILLILVLAAVLVPAWLLVRERVPAEKSKIAVKPEATMRVRRSRALAPWEHVTPLPRGAAVSTRAKTAQPVREPPPPTMAATPEERWGIEVCNLVLSMGNAVLDLRYKVLDADKVNALAGANVRAYILEPVSGTRLFLTPPPREGCFPPGGNRLAAGTTYFAAVRNPHGIVKRGSKVALVIGDAGVSDLEVE